MEFKNCRLEVILVAQSPMVHFQADEKGAVLRGSEVKPKLDKFLIKRAKEEGVKLPKGTFLHTEDPTRKALNYKVTIKAIGKKQIWERNLDNSKEFGFIFGDRNKKLILQNAKLEILCMNTVLQKLISENIVKFFAVTNFGFRQDKGFGSFIPKEYLTGMKKDEVAFVYDISGQLMNTCKSSKCYYIKFDEYSGGGAKSFEEYSQYFRQMKDFYDLLKSGRNDSRKNGGYSRSYIYQYMHDKGIGNEKAWMKRKGIAPILVTNHKINHPEMEDKHPARYVRALLGVGSHVDYINSKENKKNKVKIKITQDRTNNKLEIQRMESPIIFKIVANYVFICAKRIPQEIYNQNFTFETGKIYKGHEEIILKTGGKGTISVPSKEELEKVNFSIDDLLDKYVKYYNSDELRKCVSLIRNNEKVEEVM